MSDHPDNRPTVLVTNDDLLRVLAGSTMGVSCADGTEVNLRLFTADELEVSMRESRAKYGVEEPPGGDRPHAVRLTQSVDLSQLVR